MPSPRAALIELSAEEKLSLERLVRAHSTPQSLALRARVVLRAAEPDRPTNLTIAGELGCKNDTAGLWRRRFAEGRLAALQDLPRPGRPRAFSPLATPSRP